MLFKSAGSLMVERSLLEAKWNAEVARQTAAANKLNLYKDDYEDPLSKAIMNESKVVIRRYEP